MSLDSIPLLDARGNPLSVRRGDHIRRFNELNKVMASMPDLYEAGKTASPEVLESLRKDFKETWIISSTRIHYEKSSLEAVITHYFNSTVTTPQPINLLVPFYNGVKLDDVLETEEGLHYLQALFNTNDNAETIKKTLEKLSNKKSKDIKVWTPDQNNRKEYQDRAAGFNYYYYCQFLVYGDNCIFSDGRSRGVLDNPLGGALENRALQGKNDQLGLPFDLVSGINKKGNNVYFSNVQTIGSFVKYSGLFCFKGNRFVISLTIPAGKEHNFDEEIGILLAQDASSKDKVDRLNESFSPLYAHLVRYEQNDSGFVEADDVEFFGKPRIKVEAVK